MPGRIRRRVLVVVAVVMGAIAVAALIGSLVGHNFWYLAAEGTVVLAAIVAQLVTTDRDGRRRVAIPRGGYGAAIVLAAIGGAGCVAAVLTTTAVPVRIGMVIMAVGAAASAVSLLVAHRRAVRASG